MRKAWEKEFKNQELGDMGTLRLRIDMVPRKMGEMATIERKPRSRWNDNVRREVELKGVLWVEVCEGGWGKTKLDGGG